MNIAEITTYKEGGAYTHVVELVKKIKENILIISGNTKNTGFQQENGNNYYHIPTMLSIWDIFFINKIGSNKKFSEILNKNNIDILHFHSPLFTFPISMMRKRKYPSIMTTHYLLEIKTNRIASSIYKVFIKWVTRNIAENVDKIICVNKDYLTVFSNWGINPNKLVHIPNGVDTKKFSPGKSKIKEKYKKNKLIIYFGRLHYQKNVDLLIRSFKYIKKKVENVKLIIIGDGTDYNKLKKISYNDDDIIMTGFLSDDLLIDYLRAANIVVFPSRGENASFTLMEAMSCKIPVISSDTGNAKSLLADERGLILEKYTEKELAEKCEFLLKNDGISKKMGKNSRDYVQKNFSWDKISSETQKLYKTIIN